VQNRNAGFSPGALGLPGGYPVKIDGRESIENGTLTYTEILLEKVKKTFTVNMPKRVPFADINKTAKFIIDNIIKSALPVPGSI